MTAPKPRDQPLFAGASRIARMNAERDALQARVKELENIDRIGDLEDSLGRALSEANQLAARVEELEAALRDIASHGPAAFDEPGSAATYMWERARAVLRSDRREER